MKTVPDYMDKNVVCPFYIREETLKIRCEGYRNGTKIHLCFDCKNRKTEHKKKYCKDMDNYKDCPLYAVIDEQYKNWEDENEQVQ